MWTKKSAKTIRKQVRACLQNFVSIGSYSPEVRTFGTLITSTKVFTRDLTILYLEIVDSIHKQVRECIQNCYQSVAIHLKYVFLYSYNV